MSPPALRAALLAAAAAALAYQLPLRLDLDAGPGLLSAALFEGTWAGPPRWTAGRALIRVPDPGPGRRLQVELELDGWRPPGQPPPRLSVRSGSSLAGGVVGPAQNVRLELETGGWWSSDVELALQSETYRPGGGDPRELGVRLYRLQASDKGPWRPRRPPLGALAWAALAAALLSALRPPPAGRRWPPAELAFALLVLLGYGWQRPWAALLAAPACAGLALALALARVFPAGLRRTREAAADTWLALLAGARTLAGRRWALAALCALLLLGLVERSERVLELDLGSGQEAALVRDLGPYQSAGGTRFRAARRGAVVDFGSLGSGPLEVTLWASTPERRSPLRLGQLGQEPAVATQGLGPEWQALSWRAEAPWGWDSGLQLELSAAAEAAGVRLDRLRVERQAGAPSARPLLALWTVGLLCALVASAAGAGPARSLALASAVWLLLGAALRLAPLVCLPHAPSLAAVAGGGLLVWALARTASRALGSADELPEGAVAAAGLGFAGWLGALTWPLYQGGHFGFHSQIAEEIWKGRFLIYYLPYPGSMLSQQAQWGNVIVPHPCLYHTLVAPLAALPQAAFHALEKVFLALLLAATALVAGRLAARLAGPRAGTWAAAAFALLVAPYQLLGLGHLMTLLGVWAGSLALAFVGRRADGLDRRAAFYGAAGLLTLAFLSYTATLLFCGLVLTAWLALLWRREPGAARRVALALAVAGGLAFGLYYVNWAWPFLSESVPRWLHGAVQNVAAPEAAAARDRADHLQRLLAQPQKLAYTYGSWLVPLAAGAGLLRLRASRERSLLLLWMGVLWLFSLLVDPFFNLLLKHHYFVAVPVAVGLAAWESAGSRLGRWAAPALFVPLLGLWLLELVAVATGGTP